MRLMLKQICISGARGYENALLSYGQEDAV